MAGHRDLNERKLSNTTFITTETESVRPTTALSAAPTTSPRNFEFIHLSHDAPTADAGARQRVRSHAMRDFRRRKGLPDMFDEQETGKSPSPGTSGPSPPSVEVRHQGSDPTDQGFKRLTPENKTRVPLGSSSSSAQQHQSLPDNPMSSQTESSDTAGIVDQQGPNLPSRPENVAHEQPDIDRGKSLVPQNNPAALLGNDSGGEPQDPSDTTLEAQKRSDSNALAMVRVPSAASFDPFNSLPVISTERVRVLVHYCKMTTSSLLTTSPSFQSCVGDRFSFVVYRHATSTNHRTFWIRPFLLHSYWGCHEPAALLVQQCNYRSSPLHCYSSPLRWLLRHV